MINSGIKNKTAGKLPEKSPPEARCCPSAKSARKHPANCGTNEPHRSEIPPGLWNRKKSDPV